MKLILILFLLFATTTHAAEVKNLKTGQQGEKGFAQYDLAGKPGEKQADVTVFIELGNDRYAADKLSLSGDFGKGVKVGVGKKIFWDVLKDMPAGFEGEAVWDVEASGGVIATPATTPKPVANVAETGKDSANGMEFEKDGFRFYKDVVVDTKTGLMWARNGNVAGKEMKWDDAMEWVKTLDIGGYRDWRLPTKEELKPFARLRGEGPAAWFNVNGFKGVQDDWYWSSSIADNINGAWSVTMRDGRVKITKVVPISYVWPVRGGE